MTSGMQRPIRRSLFRSLERMTAAYVLYREVASLMTLCSDRLGDLTDNQRVRLTGWSVRLADLQ
jgi:hypothetical protein